MVRLLLFLLWLPASPAAGASADGLAWSATGYVRAVLRASPEVRQSLESLGKERAEERSRRAKTYFPSLTFTGVLNPAELAPGDRFTFDAWRANANDLTLTPGASWNLFNNFRDSLRLRNSRLGRDQAEQDLETARQGRALEALRAYYGLLLRDKLLEVARQNSKVQRGQYELTLDRYEHGMKSLSDLLKTETDWRSSELGVQTAQAQRRLALFKFNVLIEREEGLEASFPPSLALGTTEAPRLEEDLRSALLDRPEMKKNRLELKAADNTYKLAKIEALPALSLDFDLTHPYDAQYGETAPSFGMGTAVYALTLKLSLPSSFNFYSQAQDVIAARATWRKKRLSRETLRRKTREEVYQAHIELMRALRSHEISLRKEDISRQNLEIVQEQYSQGSADVIRLSQAQTDYVNAQKERMQAFHDANINRARYQRAIGEPIWH